MQLNTDALLRLLADGPVSGTPITVAYHPDADPGDGSGWCIEVGDWKTSGDLDSSVTRALEYLDTEPA